MQRFENQTAIVAGGARGIGKGIAERIVKEGGKVALFDVLETQLDATVDELKNVTPDVLGFTVDVTNAPAVKASIQKVVTQWGRLDIMVNCAGIVGQSATKILEYDDDIFKKVLDINLTGAYYLTKYAIAPMVSQQYGRILHITSIGGKEGNPGMVGYAASKAGMFGLIKGVGKEYADKGITVNGLAPAVVATEMNADTDPQMLAYMTAKIPMGRLGTIEEAAALSCWIVSKEASFNTGFIFDLSGGRATY